MGRAVALNALKAGIDRQRNKGGADPGSLYDLENAYVTLAGTLVSRPGTTEVAELPAGTHGLCAFEGAMVVFAIAARTPMPAGYTCEIIVHPTAPTTEILEIHYAGPFLGYLYVVVEFVGGDVFHYWLQARDAWEAETVYQLGELVEPTVRNGFAYKAHRLTPPGVVWAPNVPRTVGDVVEPTTPNGYEYEVIDTIGSAPRSGATEPEWPTEEGATISEDTDLSQPTPPTPGGDDGDTRLPQDVIDRYGVWGTFGRLFTNGTVE